MYRIDRDDRIVFADDKWLRFTYDHGGVNYKPENVLNKSLWNFITDDLTRQFYKAVLRRAREGDTINFSFRGVSANCRRLLEMTVAAGQNGDVRFETKTLLRQKRESPTLFGKPSGGDAFLRICGWCRRIEVSLSDWDEIENAVTKLILFERDCLTQLTHGICNSCFEAMNDKLGQRRQPETLATT